MNDYLEQKLDRPGHSIWSYVTEGIKYMWEPGKTCKNEIMRGEMTPDRIREVIQYGLDNKDSWGRETINEDSLKFLYEYNIDTINGDKDLYEWIKKIIIRIRRDKQNSSGFFNIDHKSGTMQEIILNTEVITWLR